jgi:hypothetical protein
VSPDGSVAAALLVGRVRAVEVTGASPPWPWWLTVDFAAPAAIRRSVGATGTAAVTACALWPKTTSVQP